MRIFKMGRQKLQRDFGVIEFTADGDANQGKIGNFKDSVHLAPANSMLYVNHV